VLHFLNVPFFRNIEFFLMLQMCICYIAFNDIFVRLCAIIKSTDLLTPATWYLA